ncbi:MAG: porin [Planctomycetaceae bacterium]
MSGLYLESWGTLQSSGRTCRFAVRATPYLLAIAGMLGWGPVTSAQDGLSAFSNEIEPPYLTSTLDETSTDSIAENPDAMDIRFSEMQKELDALKSQLAATNKQSDSLKKLTDKLSAPAATVFPSAKLTGFFQADAGWFQQSANSTAQLGDLHDNAGFRRARLASVGKVAEDVSYMLEMDFAFAGRPTFMDLWVTFAKVPGLGNVRVGQYRMPFGMDELTSVKELTFLERPSTQPMGPFRQVGVGFFDTTADENITWAAAAFRSGTNQFANSFGDDGYGLASRITAVAAEDKHADFLIHTGLGYCLIADPNNQFRYINNPEYVGPTTGPAATLAITDPGTPAGLGGIPPFTNTGFFAANNANLFNGELAATWGSWHAQSELRFNVLNLNSGGTAVFPSFYAQTGYILTGEHRPYNKPNAVLGRVKPTNAVGKGGAGAWEVAARFSTVDLNSAGINGGATQDITYGLNWYLNDFTKFQFNYIDSNLSRAAGAPLGTDPLAATQIDGRTGIFAVRCQVDF